jgi:hypothetical protein
VVAPRFPIPEASELLNELVADVTAMLDPVIVGGGYLPPAFHSSTRTRLTHHLATALRLLAFYQAINLDGVLVSVANTDEKVALENGLGVAPLFDIFNPRARAIVERSEGTAGVYEAVEVGWLRQWARSAAQPDKGLAVISQQAASTGFMTLFVDSLRSVVQAFTSGNVSSSVDFTFHSNPPGG